jgi:PAS domain S-box-containing protein
MGESIRSMDWSGTPLGPVESWPQSLRTSVSTCLNCSLPILLWWGQDFTMLYNDAYRPILEEKHPRALGQKGRECWPELWDVIGPMLKHVLTAGEAIPAHEFRLSLNRDGHPEECCFSFSFSPIRDESGGVGGVFCPAIETAGKIVGQLRRRNAVVDGVGRIFHEALTCRTEEELGRVCLQVAEGTTQSKFGFIGEINPKTNRLDGIAIGDSGWGSCRMPAGTGHGKKTPINFKIHGIYGRVLLDGKSLFTNDPLSHPDSVGTPPGHPPLQAFLGVPLIHGGKTIGMIGLANREGGYGPEELASAEALAPAIVQAFVSKRAEEALAESEERFRTMADTAPVLIWISGPDKRCTYFNQRWLKFTGRTLEQELGDGWVAGVHPEDRQRCMDIYGSAFDARESFEMEYRLRRHDGEYRWIRDSGIPRGLPENELAGYVGSCIDITDYKVLEQALKDADRCKDEFLAILAHELRNPLAPIRNGIQILRLARGNPDAMNHALEMMERQLRHMVRLIDDLLDLSRISRGKIALQKAQVELADIVRQAVETSRPLIAQSGHRLTIGLPAESVFVEADTTRLAQAFANLLNNAAKYTETGGCIALTVERQDREAVVRVKDSGVGIPPLMLSRVFDIFTQVDRSLEKSQGGLGIGLSLVKRLVEMHGGTVEAHSEGVGQGSEFIIRLPIFRSSTPESRVPGHAEGTSGAPARHRVLIADDNADAAASLSMLIEMMGHEVRTARDGLEAVEAAAAFRPELILLDIGMPRLNGYDACRRIRAESWGRDIVIAALTGWGQDEDKRQSRAAGFTRHLVKPVDPAVLEPLLAALPKG